ncbi:hypothetical protein M404DRAFT_607140 [Pisolithus tinctorius Marx 270]|uniref:Uncharacterized protein n=1 Tax=Pisolithus tinctorius Marx 270 TaxID=870435 RepID=A0A0C3J439_PISTI|nr:hypothetical protein M404DRAFT_607140 [Pisolithus tinctorius Marx 270]
MFKYGFPPEFRREVLEHHPASEYSVLSLMSTAKEVLRSSSGLWKSSKVDSSRAQPSRDSDNRSPRRCHSFKSYLASGKCLLVNSRVVLPTGQEIPCEVAGRTLRDRLDNWSSLTSQLEARTGSSPTRSLSPTAAPSRSVFDTPLEPVVPDPPAIQSRRSSAECSRSSPHAQPQSRWPHTQGESPSRRHSCSHSQTRKGSYIHSKDEFIPVQSYARSLIQHHTRRRSYSYSTNSSPPSSSSSSSSRSCSRSCSRKADSYVRSKPKQSRSRSHTPRRSRRAH